MAAPPGLRAWIRAASWIVPARDRSAWRAEWGERAEDWHLLAERGEPVGGAASLARLAIRDAAGERFDAADFRQLVRAPLFVPVAMAAALLLVAAVSHGFAVTRTIADIARDMRANPHFSGAYDPRGDHVFKYLAPVGMAWITGIGLLAMGCRWLRGPGWRYWLFLAVKAAGVLVLATLAWVEIGALLRAPIRHEGWRILTGLLMVIAFVPAMGRAMVWAVADQRQRCPVCLRRLVAPVAVGSWASLFEPPATEFLCESGHGALTVADAETNGQDRWTRLDESWRPLFR